MTYVRGVRVTTPLPQTVFFNSSQKAGPESEIASTRAVIATHGVNTCGQPIAYGSAI